MTTWTHWCGQASQVSSPLPRQRACRARKVAGIADVATGASLTPDHSFRIGSVTKLFVATVVLLLVGEGALALGSDRSQRA